mmetsp:Transcript_158467/g.279727  ORF Transcript_158467/g.279727 Transcript_158467/m.279727 type:complete len:361 (-) Transcript_158467:141-1223(-)
MALAMPSTPQSFHAESAEWCNNPTPVSRVRSIEKLEGAWLNSDSPCERYIVQGLRITRTDARGVRHFTLHWDQQHQRWQWGARGRLFLVWIADNAIAWVPEEAHGSQDVRAWRWERVELPMPVNSYGPTRSVPHSQRHTELPYSPPARHVNSWRDSARDDDFESHRGARSGERRSHGHSQRDDHYHRDNHDRHRGRHRDHDYHRDHRDRDHGHHSHRHQSHRDNRRGSHGHDRDRGSRNRDYHSYGGISANVALPCGLTAVELQDLLFRDITPEDYDMLCRLDEAAPKPSASAGSVQTLPKAVSEDFMGGSCSVCLSSFEVDDEVRTLPCQHHFHDTCITKWLTEHRRTCPLCCREAIPA